MDATRGLLTLATAAALALGAVTSGPVEHAAAGQVAASAPDRVYSDVTYDGDGALWIAGWTSHSYGESTPFVVRRDGSRWVTTQLPFGPGLAGIGGLAAIAPDDVWAVGGRGYIEGMGWSVAMHWNGSDWTQTPTPDPVFEDGLSAVDGAGSDDVWAVGSSRPSLDAGYSPLILHWDGSTWTTIDPPAGSEGAHLDDVDVRAADDVWAVGTGYRGKAHPVALHFDGTVWTTVPVRHPGSSGNTLVSVSAAAADDVWAVGQSWDQATGNTTLIEHWNGTRWQTIPSPSPGENANELSAVDARTTSDVWAVGNSQTRRTERTLIEHWDGTSWTRVASPVRTDGPEFTGAAAYAEDAAFAVGARDDPRGHLRTMAERWDGHRWTEVHIPRPDN